VSGPPCQLKADVFATPGYPARTRVVELPAGRGRAVAEMLPQARPELGSSGAVPGVTRTGRMDGLWRRGPAGWR
jgi:hypothetical protein